MPRAAAAEARIELGAALARRRRAFGRREEAGCAMSRGSREAGRRSEAPRGAAEFIDETTATAPGQLEPARSATATAFVPIFVSVDDVAARCIAYLQRANRVSERFRVSQE